MTECVEVYKSSDGFTCEIHRRVTYNGEYLYYAVHRLTGETLLGGCVFQDVEQCKAVIDLPR